MRMVGLSEPRRHARAGKATEPRTSGAGAPALKAPPPASFELHLMAPGIRNELERIEATTKPRTLDIREASGR